MLAVARWLPSSSAAANKTWSGRPDAGSTTGANGAPAAAAAAEKHSGSGGFASTAGSTATNTVHGQSTVSETSLRPRTVGLAATTMADPTSESG